MQPTIDVKVTKGGPFPAAFLYLKYWVQAGDCWPREIRKEHCISHDCDSIVELKLEVEEIKAQLDACVRKAERSFKRIRKVAGTAA
jgi:hypothetical protein